MISMGQSTTSPIKVLIALTDEWDGTLQQVLEQAGFLVLLADSKEEALSIIKAQDPSAVVMISDWALESAEGTADGLMESLKGEVPTVSLISQRTWQRARDRWFDYLYHPPLHEYCSVPVDREEIIVRLEETLEAAANRKGGQRAA
jgi:DNA-binding NtrC family response regulator